MIPFQSTGLRYDGSTLSILDQSLLPGREVWQPCEDVETLIDMMRRLAVRGAPAIGVSAAVLMAVLAERGVTPEQFRAAALRLRQARPTAVNLMNSIDRLLQVSIQPDYPASVIAMAQQIYLDDVAQCEHMAMLGAELIGDREKILTHCNTGGLATAGIGTALGVVIRAHQLGKQPFVWVDETRPLLQGGRLTAWECLKHNIEHRIVCDGAAASLMQRGDVQRVFVGSDRIAANGDFANKIGTYSLAVVARYHRIPFYVVAPVTTVDPECASGRDIPIEQRDEEEVCGVRGANGAYRWAPSNSRAANPAFDVTPAELVTAWILDTGIFSGDEVVAPGWWAKKRGSGNAASS